MNWQHFGLNISDLICFVIHTCAPDREHDFVVLCLIYVHKHTHMRFFRKSLLENSVDFLLGNWTCIVIHSQLQLD